MKKPAAQPLNDVLNEWLRYEPETGVLYWRKGRGRYNQYGDCKAGHIHNGYVRIRLQYIMYGAHRLAWQIHYGSIDPNKCIDHINGDRADNRISNLRLVSHRENSFNRPCSRNNPLGVSGVSRYYNRFHLRMCKKHYGAFGSLEEAELARWCVEERLYGDLSHAKSVGHTS